VEVVLTLHMAITAAETASKTIKIMVSRLPGRFESVAIDEP
jgi:hypothetical protein